jgi:predicted regulator of Ras-like GTPase activity (Roadblock/LC7/MglB family)
MDRDSPKLDTAQAEINELNQQLVAVTEHRSRVMVLLTERSREIADLTTELGRSKTEALRHLEDGQSTARQLRRANEKLVELSKSKATLEGELHRIADELAGVRLELTATKSHSSELERELRTAQADVTRLRQEVDAAKRTLEAQSGSWDQERQQLAMTVSGLTLEIQNEHQAARVLERKWVRLPPQPLAEATRSGESGVVDLRLAHAQAVQTELEQLREERATLSAQVRELERDAGASRELSRLQQDLRNALVDKSLLERRLEDAVMRDREREDLHNRIAELQQNRLDADLARAEVERLRLRLYKAPLHSGTFATRVEPHQDDIRDAKDHLDTELQRLALQTEARSAVVADHRGFPVASLGGTRDSEVLAAVAGEAERFSRQARQLLEISEVTQFTLQDRNGTIAHYRFFALDEDVMTVATLGMGLPDESTLDRVVTATIQRLTDPRERAARIKKSGTG